MVNASDGLNAVHHPYRESIIMNELNQFSVFLAFFTMTISGFMIRAWFQEAEKIRRNRLNKLYAECNLSQLTEV